MSESVLAGHADVAVVGAGPIGLEIAVSLKQHGVNYLHFDARQIGYTISWFAPQTKFFSSNERIAIAGVPLHTTDQSKATREEYLNYLRTVVELHDLKVNTYEPITGIEREGEGFLLTTRRADATRRYRVRRIILATGGTDHPRKLDIPGEDLPHVSAYLRDPHTYFRTNVLIVGGKNSAVEAALRCHHAGARVAMSYRREQLPEQSIKYWLMPEMQSLFKTGKIASHFDTVPVAITRSHVTLQHRKTGARFDVPADFVLLLIGYEQDNTLFKLAGVEIRGDCGAPVFDEATMETNVPGIYVAGTAVAGTQDKYRVFIENCHVHAERIVAAITGEKIPASKPLPEVEQLPES